MDRAVYERMGEIDRDHWWFVARRHIVSNVLRRYVSTDKALRILEVGCGTGSNIPMLREFGNVDAVEPDDAARAVAAGRYDLAVKSGYLPDGVSLEDGAYDIIVLLDVLEHIPDDDAALNSLRAKLAPGGMLLITVPASPWLWSDHDVAHHHHRRYTLAALKEALEKSGFSIRHHSHFNSLLFPAIVTARLLGRLMGRNGGDDAMPHPFANQLLEKLFSAERYWVPRIPVPVGISLIALATRAV